MGRRRLTLPQLTLPLTLARLRRRRRLHLGPICYNRPCLGEGAEARLISLGFSGAEAKVATTLAHRLRCRGSHDFDGAEVEAAVALASESALPLTLPHFGQQQAEVEAGLYGALGFVHNLAL